MFGGADGDVVVVEPEVDLVAWFDAEQIAEILGDDNLSLCPDAVGHTVKYNSPACENRPRRGRPSSILFTTPV